MSVKLSELCELIVDCPHSTAPDEGEGYPLIRTPNIGPGYFDLSGVHRVSEETYNKRNARTVPQPNDLILAREAPAGNVAIIPEGAKMCLGQRTVLIRPDIKKVHPVWLNYYLNAPDQRHALLKNANGATVSHVNMPIIRNLPVVAPRMDEQKRIAHILSAYDKLIENNLKQVKLLEEAAQRLYKEWFIDFKFPGHENVATIDGIPEGWREGTLSEVVEFKRGKTITAADTETGNVPVVAGGLTPAYYHSKSNTSSPVITVSGSGANAGYTHLYTERIWASDCSFTDAEMTDVLLFVYESIINLGHGFKHLQRGSAQPHVYPKHVNSMKMIIPTEELRGIFSERVNLLFSQIQILRTQSKYLMEARNRMLPKLMSGEIEVM